MNLPAPRKNIPTFWTNKMGRPVLKGHIVTLDGQSLQEAKLSDLYVSCEDTAEGAEGTVIPVCGVPVVVRCEPAVLQQPTNMMCNRTSDGV